VKQKYAKEPLRMAKQSKQITNNEPPANPPFSVKPVMMKKVHSVNFAETRRANKKNPQKLKKCTYTHAGASNLLLRITKEIVSVANFVIGVIKDKKGILIVSKLRTRVQPTPSTRG